MNIKYRKKGKVNRGAATERFFLINLTKTSDGFPYQILNQPNAQSKVR